MRAKWWYQSQRGERNRTMFLLITRSTNHVCLSSYPTLGGKKRKEINIWRQIEFFFSITTHTYQQIRWSDCQYRRPGSCNRRTRSRWISPFLMEEERGKEAAVTTTTRATLGRRGGLRENWKVSFFWGESTETLWESKEQGVSFDWESPRASLWNMREKPKHNKRILQMRQDFFTKERVFSEEQRSLCVCEIKRRGMKTLWAALFQARAEKNWI